MEPCERCGEPVLDDSEWSYGVYDVLCLQCHDELLAEDND